MGGGDRAMGHLCGALKGRQVLVGTTGHLQEKVQQLMVMCGAHGSGQKNLRQRPCSNPACLSTQLLNRLNELPRLPLELLGIQAHRRAAEEVSGV